MPTPQEIRNIRLKNDYAEMCNIRSNIIQWKAITGMPPYVEEYEITIKVHSIIGSGPNYRDEHVVKLVLPANYPLSPPHIEMITSPQPFHPNWYTSKKWCYGSWDLSESLGHHVIRMIRTLQFDLDITNEHSPANGAANSWFISHRESGIFPCDTQVLPDPTKKQSGFVIRNEKKKFDIIK